MFYSFTNTEIRALFPFNVFEMVLRQCVHFCVHAQAVQCQTESNVIKFSMLVVLIFIFPEETEAIHSAFTILRNINLEDCTESWGGRSKEWSKRKWNSNRLPVLQWAGGWRERLSSKQSKMSSKDKQCCALLGVLRWAWLATRII